MNTFIRKKPPTNKPHIYKIPGIKRSKICWRCATTHRGYYVKHDATAPIFAFRGVKRKMVAMDKFGPGGYAGAYLRGRVHG